MVAHFKELVAWQKAMELAAAVYELTRAWPSGERYGLTSQLQRAAVSIPANIAEGHERRSTREYRRYIAIACGSAAELETHVLLATRIGLCAEDAASDVLERVREVGRILRAIDRTLAARQRRPAALSPEP